ncbi:MAG: hypothetical protein ABSA83_15565 [Verrucomicrobiota bacterium]|jgi:hypothetical protein
MPPPREIQCSVLVGKNWTAAGSKQKVAKSPVSEKSEISRISRRDLAEKSWPQRFSDCRPAVPTPLQENLQFGIGDFMVLFFIFFGLDRFETA